MQRVCFVILASLLLTLFVFGLYAAASHPYYASRAEAKQLEASGDLTGASEKYLEAATQALTLTDSGVNPEKALEISEHQANSAGYCLIKKFSKLARETEEAKEALVKADKIYAGHEWNSSVAGLARKNHDFVKREMKALGLVPWVIPAEK